MNIISRNIRSLKPCLISLVGKAPVLPEHVGSCGSKPQPDWATNHGVVLMKHASVQMMASLGGDLKPLALSPTKGQEPACCFSICYLAAIIFSFLVLTHCRCKMEQQHQRHQSFHCTPAFARPPDLLQLNQPGVHQSPTNPTWEEWQRQ